MIEILVVVVVVLVILGILIYMVNRFLLIDPTLKLVINAVLCLIAVLVILRKAGWL